MQYINTHLHPPLLHKYTVCYTREHLHLLAHLLLFTHIFYIQYTVEYPNPLSNMTCSVHVLRPVPKNPQQVTYINKTSRPFINPIMLCDRSPGSWLSWCRRCYTFKHCITEEHTKVLRKLHRGAVNSDELLGR